MLIAAALVVVLTAVLRGQAVPADGEARVKALESEALAALRAGEPARAVGIARQGRDLAGELGLTKRQADLRRMLARCLASVGDHRAALAELEAAEKTYAAIGDEVNRIGAVGNKGIVLRLMGDLAGALRLQHEALAYEEKAGDPNEIAGALINIGIIEDQRSNHRAAAEAFERGLAMDIDDERRMRLIGNLALNYANQGDLELSLQYLRQAAEMSAKLGQLPEEITWWLDYGSSLNDARRYEEALPILRRTLARIPPEGGYRAAAGINNEIGRSLFALGRVEEAGAAYEAGLARARAGSEPDQLINALAGVASVRSRLGDHAAAEALAREALVEAERTQFPRGIATAQETLGDVLRAAGRLPEARAAYDGAIAVVERVRTQTSGGDDERLNFFQLQLPPYHAVIDLLVTQGRFEEAFGYMERARSRVLVDVMQRGRTTLPGALTPVERDEERRLSAAVVSASARLASAAAADRGGAEAAALQARNAERAFRLRMLARYPQAGVATGETRFAGLDAAGPLVADGATRILVYTVTESRTYVASITRGANRPSLQVVTLPIGREALTARVRAFRARVAARDLGVAADARALFDLFVAPAGALEAGTTRLLIAPDAALWELPFQALQAADGRYLVERSAIAYAPSLTALATARTAPRPQRPRELLALGNPVLRAGGPPPLVEAERQVTAIARRFPAGQREVRVGPAATEAAIKAEAGRSRIVHIAAHGTLDAASPMYSALLLAPGSAQDDGRLEARELAELDLGASLVVLSACETARGRVSAGEGIIGLSWAALVAGARRVVVSQWKVDAASTTDLMTGFYRHLRAPADAPARDEADALRAAALELLRRPSSRHPFYWAAFTVVGG